MKFEYVYTITPEQARERIEALGEYLANRHKIAVTCSHRRADFGARPTTAAQIRDLGQREAWDQFLRRAAQGRHQGNRPTAFRHSSAL